MPTKINKDQQFNVEIVKISVYCFYCAMAMHIRALQ